MLLFIILLGTEKMFVPFKSNLKNELDKMVFKSTVKTCV